jgi:hypothetical protein
VDVSTGAVKSHDIQLKARIEVKRERAVERFGNVAIELECGGMPSGVNASESDIWIWELGGEFWFAWLKEVRSWLQDNREKYEIKMGGDGRRSKLAIIPLIHFVNGIATRISNAKGSQEIQELALKANKPAHWGGGEVDEAPAGRVLVLDGPAQ